MFVRTFGATFRGVEVTPLTIEIRMDRGIQLQVAGLPGRAAQDCLLRIRSAWKQLQIAWPRQAVTISVSPAVPAGSEPALDLPIALGLLGALGHIPKEGLATLCSAGELRLDGTLTGSPALMATAFAATAVGCQTLILPESLAREAAGLEPKLSVHGAAELTDVIRHLQHGTQLRRFLRRHEAPLPPAEVRMEQLRLTPHARATLLLAAAGNHHLLMVGPPGTGKSIMARCLHGLLPPLAPAAAAEVKRIHAAKGLTRPHDRIPPLRSPHAGTGVAAMLGSRPGIHSTTGHCTPGEMSLAHHGVLCLDEFPEFPRSVIEGLRQPLETRRVDLARAGMAATLPANALVVATANPCPCGYFGDVSQRCKCAPQQVRNYLRRLSGPMIDRFDLHLETQSDAFEERSMDLPPPWPLTTEAAWESVRRVQTLLSEGPRNLHETRTPLVLPEAQDTLHHIVRHFGLTARGKSRLTAIARTLSLIEQDAWIPLRTVDMERAAGWRLFDRRDWHESAFDVAKPRHLPAAPPYLS